MAASVRLLSSRALDRHLRLFGTPAPRSLTPLLSLPLRNPNALLRTRNGASSAWVRSAAVSSADGGDWQPAPLSPCVNQLFLSISCSDLSKDHIDRSLPDQDNGFRLCDSAGELAVGDGGAEKGAIWMVVLLGWLGAEEKHLKRYADIYHARGIRSLRFVVPLWDLVGLDFGRKLQGKVEKLAEKLSAWCSESERDGRKRYLLFHTFSNTGWLVYGSLLKDLQSRKHVMDMIKGCVVDSGPAPDISPKVFAAGFCAALLKKRSSTIHPSAAPINGHSSSKKALKSHLLKIIVMFLLERVFSIILILPDVRQRYSVVLSFLSKHQPPCPQLYLYSSADTVIPASAVESFIQEQRALGRNVRSYNFGTSPHVDHFRSFPHIYSAKLGEFVAECCAEIVCRA